GKIRNGDRFRNGHLAHELFLRLVRGLALEALRAAAERGDGALAHFVGAQRVDQRQASALLLDGRARRRTRRGGRTGAAAGAARHARAVIVVGLDRHAPRGLARLVLAETPFGDFAGLAFRFLVVLAADFLVAFARLGGFALGAVAGFARGFAARFFLGDLAFFRLAHARVGKRVRARAALFLGQRAQHDAGRPRRLGRARRRRPGGGRGRLHLLGRCGFRTRLGRAADGAAFYLFDHHLLAAAMAKAVAHHARFRARLERQLQFLFARVFCFTHVRALSSCAVRRRDDVTFCRRLTGPKAL